MLTFNSLLNLIKSTWIGALMVMTVLPDMLVAQDNLFFGPNHEETMMDEVSVGSSHTRVRPLPFNPSETISFDKRMTFSAHTGARSSTSQFLVNSEKGYMGMDKNMMENFSGVELPDNDQFKIFYRVTATNGRTYYFVEINGERQVINRLPADNIESDQTNMSVKKFKQNYSRTGNTLNVSSENYHSKEYSGISPNTGAPVRVYVSEQNAIHINPTEVPKTVGMFGLGYIYHENKTQLVTRIENDDGTAELERIENTNISFSGEEYTKRENKLAEKERRDSELIEDVMTKKQQDINNMSDSRADIRNIEQQILDIEKERESKRKRAMNKYIDDDAPAEQNSQYAMEAFDPKDDITIRKLECQKRVLEINRMLGRMHTDNPDYSRLQNEKNCQEEKIEAYKQAELEMIAIKERHGDNVEEANKEKMNYHFTQVVPNIYGRPCAF